MHVEDIIYVPILKNNLVSILVLEYKCFQVIFMDNQPLLWLENKSLDIVVVIGVREGGLYKVLKKYIQAMVHHTISPCEL